MAKKTSWRRHAWPWDRWWHDTMRSKTVLASALRFESQNAGKVHDPKENNKSIWCIFYNQKQHCAPTRHRCYTTVGGWKIRRDIYVFISHKSDFIYYISHTGFFIWHTRHTPNPFMIPFQVPVSDPPPQRYYLHIPQPIFRATASAGKLETTTTTTRSAWVSRRSSWPAMRRSWRWSTWPGEGTLFFLFNHGRPWWLVINN